VTELAPIEAARQARWSIEDAKTVAEVAAGLAKLDALAVLAKRVGMQHEDQNEIGAAKLEGKRRGGQLLEVLERSDGGRPSENSSNVGQVSEWQQAIEQANLSRQEAWRWEQIAKIQPEVFDSYLAETVGSEDDVTTFGLLRYSDAARLGDTALRLVESTENEWYTPSRYIDAVRSVLGHIDLDPASSGTANETVKADRYFTKHEDGLKQDWHGRVFLNPPYGRLAGDFVSKLVQEHREGRVDRAIALVNAHCTDTDWFQSLWDYQLCFTDHRIDFDSAGRDKHTTSTHGSVFVHLGGEFAPPERFRDVFAEFGAVVWRCPP
jgi:phage N-6-adenine-methyltransferase